MPSSGWFRPLIVIVARRPALAQYAQARPLQADRRRRASRSRSRWSRRTGSGCSSIPAQGIAVVNELVFPSGHAAQPADHLGHGDELLLHPGAGRPDLRDGRHADAAAPAGRRSPDNSSGATSQYSGCGFADQHFEAMATSPDGVRRLGGEGQAIAGQARRRRPIAQLAEPQQPAHPVTYYSAVAPGLFDTIIAKYSGSRRTRHQQAAQ